MDESMDESAILIKMGDNDNKNKNLSFCRCLLRLPAISCISPRFRRLARLMARLLLTLFTVVVLVLFTGNMVEDRRVENLPSTTFFYDTSKVCGLILPPEYEQVNHNNWLLESNYNNKASSYKTNSESPFPRAIHRKPLLPPIQNITFASAGKARAHGNNTIVAHCGDCGACSNPHDIAIYDATKDTLLAKSTRCAKHGLIWGRRTASRCMQADVGFTSECNHCWIENIMCDLRFCVFACMWHNLFSPFREGRRAGGGAPEPLNACTLCDEKRCGPAFIRCAGANRRRAGILSDIARVDEQVCKSADEEWWKSTSLQEYYRVTRPPTAMPNRRWKHRHEIPE